MKLATIRTTAGTRAVRVDGDNAVEVGQYADVAELLRGGGLVEAESATGQQHDLAGLDFASVVTTPGKVVCVGLNYSNHILEMGRELPEFPTLFTKYPESLIGANDDIVLPPETEALDWEGELTVVVGKSVRRASQDEAREAVAGYTVANDITMRDFQYRSPQWFQGKAWEDSTPVGPYLVTGEVPDGAEVITTVAGEEKQRAPISDLVFSPVDLIAYISQIFTLNPGDIVLTGTPGGVGHARKPAQYLQVGQDVTVEVTGIGAVQNRIVEPS